MKSCDIHIQQIEVPNGLEYDSGMYIDIKMSEADMADKFMVLYSLANAMHLDTADIAIFAMAVLDGKFDERLEIKLPRGTINEG